MSESELKEINSIEIQKNGLNDINGSNNEHSLKLEVDIAEINKTSNGLKTTPNQFSPENLLKRTGSPQNGS